MILEQSRKIDVFVGLRGLTVDSSQCHLWTDALHIRQLAREAPDKWDRGTYVTKPLDEFSFSRRYIKTTGSPENYRGNATFLACSQACSRLARL